MIYILGSRHLGAKAAFMPQCNRWMTDRWMDECWTKLGNVSSAELKAQSQAKRSITVYYLWTIMIIIFVPYNYYHSISFLFNLFMAEFIKSKCVFGFFIQYIYQSINSSYYMSQVQVPNTASLMNTNGEHMDIKFTYCSQWIVLKVTIFKHISWHPFLLR